MKKVSFFNTMFENEVSHFNQDLEIKTTLEVDGEKVIVLAGNIEGFELSLFTYGFSGKIHFSGFDESKLDKVVSSQKPIHIRIECGIYKPDEKTFTPSLVLKGLIQDKYFKKVAREKGDAVLRYYEVDFSDYAQAIWSHHFPIEIYVNKTMKDVIKSQESSLFSIKSECDFLDKVHPIIALSSGDLSTSLQDAKKNFYSFLHWFLYQENGELYYDYALNSYEILGKKKRKEGHSKIAEWCVSPPVCCFKEPHRFKTQVLNHTPDSVESTLKESFTPYEKVRRDYFDSQNYRIYPEQKEFGEQSDLSFQQNEVQTSVNTLSDTFSLKDLLPGSSLKFAGNKDKKGTWSEDSQIQGKIFCINHLVCEGIKEVLSSSIKKPAQPYILRVQISLEDQQETYIKRPDFQPPTYPFYIQGTVHSVIGDDPQTTYDINQAVSGGQYLVEIPMIEDKENKVVVPFSPNMISGQYYFPLCKGEKVLLAMYFQTAAFERILDWQPLTQLPAGIQGNQIVLSSNGKERYAFIRHEYENGKESVFTIEQAFSKKEKNIIQLKADTMTHTVVNRDKKTITTTYNAEKGASWVLEDHASGMVQTAIFDGTKMLHKASQHGESSQITQKPDLIEIKCKTFRVNSEDISLTATNKIIQKGEAKVDIDTNIATVNAPTVKLGG